MANRQSLDRWPGHVPWLTCVILAIVACTVIVSPRCAWSETAPDKLLAAQEERRNLADLSLEQLANIQVTSVSKRAEPLSRAAASIYVITAEDIRRSGATSLPEALRLAPNLDVARADAVQYAITARGWNSVLANKMLVLIDGRTVYSPLFSGVFWEAQDVMLEDIDRIEVISGPGGTLWGSNAVDGVINIITRSAKDTQGLLATGGAGEEFRMGAARYGGTVGSSVHYRAYGKVSDRDPSQLTNGNDTHDSSNRTAGGFRARWDGDRQVMAVQGDAYRASIAQAPNVLTAGTIRRLSGVDVMGWWNRVLRDSLRLQLQLIYDHTERDQPGSVHDALDSYEAELQHEVRPWNAHDIVWGGGYRHQPDQLRNLAPAAFQLIPADQVLDFANAFVQDEIALRERLSLIGGIKLETNRYTHLEYLPNLRLAWQPAAQQLAWTAVSRAVRAPARVDREFFSPGQPPYVVLAGGPNFDSEIANVAEVGYRGEAWRSLSLSITGFFHQIEGLRSVAPTPSGPQFENGYRGTLHGVEAWATWRVMGPWRLSAGGVEQRKHVELLPGAVDLGGSAALGNDPNFWWVLRSSADLWRYVEWDVMVRQVGALPVPPVPAYYAADTRVGLDLPRGITLALSAQNLFDSGHPEWGPPANRAVFDRNVLVQLTWRP